MSEIKRFTADGIAHSIEHGSADYPLYAALFVLYSDHAAKIAELEREVERLKEERESLGAGQIELASRLCEQDQENASLRAQLAALQWTPITPESPAPLYSVAIKLKKPDFPHIPPWGARIVYTPTATAQLAQGLTHFCPMPLPNPPKGGAQ